MTLFMLLMLVLAKDNGLIVSPLCWILVGFYVVWRFTVLLLKNSKEWED